MLMRALALLLLLLAPQDPADKVKALVEKLGADDIVEREKVSAELVKLGPANLPQLRELASTAEGERKNWLALVIRKLERAIRKDELVRGPRITLAGGTRPTLDVLADIAKQGRCRIDPEGILPGSKVDAGMSAVSLAKAVDLVCKAHGGIMYTYSAQRIIIETKPFREPPRHFHEGVLFFLDHLLLDRAVSEKNPRLLLKPVVVWPPGSGPLAYRLESEKFEDDMGTDYLAGQQPPSWIWFRGQYGDTVSCPLHYHYFPGAIPDEARKIAIWKGKLRLRFAVELRPAISIDKPFVAERGGDSDGDYRLGLHSAKLVGDEASVSAMISTPVKDDPDAEYHNLGLANLLVLRDSKGGMIRGQGQTRPGSGAVRKEGGVATRWIEFSYKVPAGVEVVSLDLMKLEDLEDVEIPFEFKDIKLREGAR